MHGFAGWVGAQPEESAPLRHWMQKWLDVEPRKPALEVHDDLLYCLASAEPGSEGSPTAEDDEGRRLLFVGVSPGDQFREGNAPGPTVRILGVGE